MHTPRTPRELLLARHADTARPALDAQRAALLARFATSDASPASHAARTAPAGPPLAWFAVLGRELVAPYRRTWATLSCVWLALLGFQQLDQSGTPSPFVTAKPPRTTDHADAAFLALWIEQRRLLAAFDTPPPRSAPPMAKPPASPVPRPLGARTPAAAKFSPA